MTNMTKLELIEELKRTGLMKVLPVNTSTTPWISSPSVSKELKK